MKSSVWNKALPIGDISGWPFMKEVYKSGSTKLKKHHRERVLSRFLEDLRLRSDLEFLSTNDPKFIKNNVQFLNSGSRQDLGLIVLKISPKENKYKEVLIIFNNSKSKSRFKLESSDWQVHPELNQPLQSVKIL